MAKTLGPFNPFKHNAESGGFSDLSRAFKENPSIELYIEMRRKYPSALIEISTSRSMDWLCTNSKLLESFGIDPQILAGCLDAMPDRISEFSLLIMENLIKRRELESSGRAQVQSLPEIMPDSLINYLISMMLDALDWNDELFIPRDLIVLIKHQFGADISAEIKKQDVADKRVAALMNTARIRAMGKKCSIRDIAKMMGVNPTTILRWFPDSTFETELKKLIPLFDENGETEMDRFAKEFFKNKNGGNHDD